MFQSGHRRYDQVKLSAWDDAIKAEVSYGEDNWRYVDHDYEVDTKPTVDGEPSYEQIVQGLHDPTQPLWQAPEVRRYAWWSVLEGAMGHTYGHNSIIQFYETGREYGGYCVKHDWHEAIHHEAGGQMRFLKELMESVDFMDGRPNDSRLVGGQRERHDRISVFEGPGYIICYDYKGSDFALNLSDLAGKTVEARWLDPATGVQSYMGDLPASPSVPFTTPEKHTGGSDWALVLKF